MDEKKIEHLEGELARAQGALLIKTLSRSCQELASRLHAIIERADDHRPFIRDDVKAIAKGRHD